MRKRVRVRVGERDYSPSPSPLHSSSASCSLLHLHPLLLFFTYSPSLHFVSSPTLFLGPTFILPFPSLLLLPLFQLLFQMAATPQGTAKLHRKADDVSYETPQPNLRRLMHEPSQGGDSDEKTHIRTAIEGDQRTEKKEEKVKVDRIRMR